MTTLGPFVGKTQPVPHAGEKRLRECRWEPAVEFAIPADWPSGVYVGKLSAERRGIQSYVIFIVRDDRPCDFLFQCADSTWSAYNRWPSQFALYDDGENEWYIGPQTRVSWDRPYAKYCQVIDAPLSAGSGSFLLWEHPLAFWLEQQGYDVTYCSNLDLELDPGLLKTSKALLSVGHDEYWSRTMFDNALKAREDGLSIAFFSGNALSGEIIFYESSVTSAPCRARNSKSGLK